MAKKSILTMSARYFEFKDAKSNKFWEVGISGKKMTVKYGKVGLAGKALTKEFLSFGDACLKMLDAIDKKLKEGYKEKTQAENNQPILKKYTKKEAKFIEKKSIEEVLTEIYNNNIHLFKKGYFQIQYKGENFRVYQQDGSYEGSFETLIHYILFYENLYEDEFSLKNAKLAARVIKNNPSLPPYFEDDQSATDRMDWLLADAAQFTYQYMKDHKLFCEEMNEWIDYMGLDWKPLKKIS